MKEITTNGKTILFVEVPEDAYEFRMSLKMTNHLIYRRGETFAGYVNLPNFTYQILGKSTESIHELLGISKESYLSLLEANGIVDRCLMPKPEFNYEFGEDGPTDSQLLGAEIHFDECCKQYQEAQSKVKHYLALKRI